MSVKGKINFVIGAIGLVSCIFIPQGEVQGTFSKYLLVWLLQVV